LGGFVFAVGKKGESDVGDSGGADVCVCDADAAMF
jgi:hypothetical protein